MKQNLILPLGVKSKLNYYPVAGAEYANRIQQWVDERIESLKQVWTKEALPAKANAAEVVAQLIKILSHKTFNYQSKGKLLDTFRELEVILHQKIEREEPICFYFLFNGGYRAEPHPIELRLNFEPDFTEMMLLYQIGLLQQKVKEVYQAGIEFIIVVNNGVAKWVNDIPLEPTEHYAEKLRRMIASFGAEQVVKVLLQSELEGFEEGLVFEIADEEKEVSQDEHQIVERFLGRKCSKKEAQYRAALYLLAEGRWAEDLRPLIKADQGIVMRQVASNGMLSFRPFLGGAIRVQNGSLGLVGKGQGFQPKLLSAKIAQEYQIQRVYCDFPW